MVYSRWVVIIFLLASCALFSQVIRVGLYDNDPLSFIDDSGRAKGIFPEILDYIARQEGWELDIQETTFGDGLEGLQNERLDIMGAVAFSALRAETVGFNQETVISNWGVVFTENEISVQSFFDLEGLEIAVVIGDTYARELKNLARQFGIAITFRDVHGDYPDVMQMVAEGKADAAVVSHIFGSKHRYIYPLQLSTLTFHPVELRFAIAPGRPLTGQLISGIDAHLSVLKADPNSEYHRLISHYLGAPSAQREVIPRWLLQLLAISLAGLFVVLVFIWLLRVQVKRKTRDLQLALGEIETQKQHLIELNTQLSDANSALIASNEELASANETLEETYQQVDDLADGLEQLIHLSSRLTVMEVDEGRFFQDLLQAAVRLLPQGKYGGIVLEDGDDWRFVAALGHDIERLRRLRLPKAFFPVNTDVSVHTSLLKSNLWMPQEVLKELEEATLRSKESLWVSLQIRDDIFGMIFVDIPDDIEHSFNEETKRIMRAFSNLASTFIASRRYVKVMSEFQMEIIRSWIHFLEAHDRYTKGHSENVATLSAMIATEIGFPQEQVTQIYWAGLVHDVGKILIPAEVLNKPSRLSEEEYEKIKLHPTFGFDILNQSESLREIAHIVHYHHERVDGHGYPLGLTGEAIPVSSKIIAIADAYDAMTSDRSYRKGMNREQALSEMRQYSGSQFDVKILEVFLRSV